MPNRQKIASRQSPGFAFCVRFVHLSVTDVCHLLTSLLQKADLELIANKLDREEFASVVGDITEKLERLTVTVKINVRLSDKKSTILL